MTTTQLERASKLESELKSLTSAKDKWERFSKFEEYPEAWMKGYNSRQSIPTSYINNEVLKQLTLATINEKIALLQSEFDAL